MAEFNLNLPKPKNDTLPLFDELIARKSLGVPTSSTESFNKLLGTLASGQRSRAGLEVFKREPKSTNRKGILSTLFDQREGYLSAPFRAASALVADIAGFDDENLKQYNPIESAIRSARGEFAITGGDIFKVNDGDDFLTRLGKYAGALSYDIALDPVNWVGPVNVFSRKGAATLAVREGDNILAKATALLADKGQDSGALVAKLFEESGVYKAAKIQQAAGTAITEGSPMALLGMTAEGAIDDAVKVSVAGKELGRQVGESLLAEGRSGIRGRLRNLLGDDDVAKEVLRAMPADISGGVFLKRPFSGKPIARIAGGVGTTIPGFKALNTGRFLASASKPGQALSKHFGGRAGVAYAATKKSLLGGVDRNVIDGMTMLDYVVYKDAFKNAAADATQLTIHANTVLSSALATSEGLVDDAQRAVYNSDLINFFHHPALRPDDSASDITLKAYNAAQELRDQMRKARDAAAAAGVEIGDLGPNYVMLRFTDEEAKRLAELGQLDGVTEAGAKYNPSKGRISHVEYHPDPEVRAQLGGDIKDRPDIVALSAPEINKRLGRVVYEENPIKLASAYFDAVHNATTARRFANALNASGVVFRFPIESQKILNEIEAKTFLSAAAKVSPAAAAKAEAIAKKTRERLDQMLSAGEQNKVAKDVAGRVVQAASDYRAAKVAETAAAAALRDADRAVAETAQRVANIGPALQQYGEAGLDTAVADAQRIARNAQSRLTKAGKRLQEAESSFDYLSSRLPLPGAEAPTPELQAWYDTLIDADATAIDAARKVDEEVAAVADSRAEAAAVREQMMSMRSTLTAEQQNAFAAYQEAVARRAQTAEAFDAARTTRSNAIVEYRAARSDTSILTANAIDSVVGAYISARKEFFNVARQIGKLPKNMSEKELNVYNLAKGTMTEARKLMNDTLGYTRRTAAKGAGAEYARAVVKLAERVSEDEFMAARVLSDADALGELVGKSFGTDRQTALNMMGDIMRMYKVVRRYVDPEELDALAPRQRAVLSGSRSVTREKQELTAAAEALAEGAEGGIRRIGAGASDVRVPAAFRDMYAKGGIKDVLEQVYRAEQNPNEWEKFISKIYDPLALIWKTGATVGRGPAYTVTNTAGGLYNNFLGRVSAKAHILSAEMLSNVQKILREVRKEYPNKSYFELLDIMEERLKKTIGNRKIGDVNVVDLYKDFLLRGGHFSTDNFFQTQELSRLGLEVRAPLERTSGLGPKFTGEATSEAESAFRTVATWILTNPVQRSLNDFAQSSELFVRFAAFVEGYQRFGNLDSAMDLVHLLHFDYQDLANAEIWLKRLVPFYTWTRNNIPLQFRMMFVGSDQIGKIFNANAEAKEAFGVDGDAAWLDEYLPDYMDTSGGFLTYLKFGGNHLGLFPKLPMQDLDKSLMTAYIGNVPYPVPRTSELVNMLGPVIKSPIELITQRNFELGYKYETPGELLKGQLRTLVPYAGTAQRLASVAGIGQQERKWTNLMNFLVGAPYGATTFTEKQLMSGAIRKSRAESAQLNEVAAEAGVDIDWLRKELKKGTSAAAIRSKIALGEGKISVIEAQKRMDKYFGKKESQVREDYKDVLRGLRQGR